MFVLAVASARAPFDFLSYVTYNLTVTSLVWLDPNAKPLSLENRTARVVQFSVIVTPSCEAVRVLGLARTRFLAARRVAQNDIGRELNSLDCTAGKYMIQGRNSYGPQNNLTARSIGNLCIF